MAEFIMPDIKAQKKNTQELYELFVLNKCFEIWLQMGAYCVQYLICVYAMVSKALKSKLFPLWPKKDWNKSNLFK